MAMSHDMTLHSLHYDVAVMITLHECTDSLTVKLWDTLTMASQPESTVNLTQDNPNPVLVLPVGARGTGAVHYLYEGSCIRASVNRVGARNVAPGGFVCKIKHSL